MATTIAEPSVKKMMPDARRASLRRELEATRAQFHAHLKAVSDAGWRVKSARTAWTMGELFEHLTWALEYLPQEVQSAREGKGMFNMPGWMGDLLSYYYIRWQARRATPATIGARYDKAMDAVVALLETIPDADWTTGADFYGEGFHSVEDLFHTPGQHIKDHLG